MRASQGSGAIPTVTCGLNLLPVCFGTNVSTYSSMNIENAAPDGSGAKAETPPPFRE